MRQIHKGAVRNIVCLATVVFVAAWVSLAPSSEGQVNTENPRIKQGEYPPDFELPRLTLRTDETGKTVGVVRETDTIRLSSFRGKKPVCLIMSSYT